jgi:purine catabolism regulator
MSDQLEASAFRLGDLLAHAGLGLELLTGGRDAPRRRVAGAHAIEIERPTTWLGPEWIMLTTGARLRRKPDAQRGLIAELEASRATALGFGVGLVFKHVPSALLDEAGKRGFPVFVVPLRTPFRDVITTITRALLSTDLRTLQRVSSMQLYLMDALGEDDPRQAIVERLSTFLDATVVLFSPDGTVAASTGEAPSSHIWLEVMARPATVVELEVGQWHALATPVSSRRGPGGWLAVASQRTPPSKRLARQAARATAPLLAALTRIEAAARQQQDAIRAALLDEMLRPQRHRDGATITARAASLGIDFAIPARLVLIDKRPDEAFARFTQALTDHGLAQLTTRRSGAVAALVQAAQVDLRAVLAQLIRGLPDVVVGVGRPASDPDAVLESYRDARIAVHVLDRGSRERILEFEDFDLVTLMIGEARPERIQPKVDEIMDVLRRSAPLHQAVGAYFAHGLDVMRAANAMHIHHNTLRYRLGRVEEALGRPLKDPATIALLYIALAAERVAPPTDDRTPPPGAEASGLR